MSEFDGVIREFLVECHEGLDQMDRDLLAMEQNPGDRDRIDSVFRVVHTIKGTCGFFEYNRLGAVAHAGENLLGELREGRLAFTPAIATALLHWVDAVRRILGSIERTKAEGGEDHAPLIASLDRFSTIHATAISTPASPNPEATPEELAPPAVSEGNIRVDVGLLDQLMNLVGELVLARNRIQQFTAGQPDAGFGQAVHRLNMITTELQEGVMKTRMQPIGNLWNKFPRTVRDLAALCGKNVRMTMDGKDTELDKTILEAIKDPLTHLVRNAVDHGLEPPEGRRRAGKPETGLLALRAYHQGGQVIIEVSDDGRGMDADRIRQKAVDRGLVGAELVARMTEREVLRLTFLPGFSTAETITSVSGRGVGMDVVKTNIERIGGTIDLQSQPGYGTTVRVKIPLTLAIIPALIVGSGGESYAIPQVNLLELLRLSPDQASRQIERLYGTPVYRLRGNLLPLVYLDRILGVDPPDPDAAVFMVVLQADDRPFGLVVASVHDTEEIVVKPLGKHLKAIPVFAGATILGDGRVALILDAVGLARTAGVVAVDRGRPGAALERVAAETGPRQTVLLFDIGEGHRMALPLDQVARLEEVEPGAVEFASGREVFQYRGRILPLVRLERLLPAADIRPALDGPLQVVVFAGSGPGVGLVVRRILDVIETPVGVGAPSRTPGVLGSAVIAGRVTDLLDPAGAIRALTANFEPAGGMSL